MSTIGDDCYFFCTSSCSKGAACPFRHVEAAKMSKIICQHWQTTGCLRPMCKFRHSDFHIQINYSEVPCYWENQPVGCNKSNCAYKHSKPRPDFSNNAGGAVQTKPASPVSNDANSNKTQESDEKFIMPTVRPVIIDPESEASNSSPLKNPPKNLSQDVEPKAGEIKVYKNKVAKPEITITEDIEVEELEEEEEEEEEKPKKKAVTKVGKKKKNGVLTPKSGKVNASKTGNKVKKDVPNTSSKTGTLKRKKVAEKSVVPAKKSVKDRLGGNKPSMMKRKKLDQEESSDSDDSIENVKVLSMEEIFRQKALESMMKKRASEGKPMLPSSYPSKKPNVISSRPAKPAPVIKTKRKPVVKKPPTPPPPLSESEEEEEEEEDEEEEEESVTEIEEEEDGEDSEVIRAEAEIETSESEDSSSSSESEDDEVRRVVINLDAEKTARDRAKQSLMKKKKFASSSPAVLKRKVISDKPISKAAAPRLSVRERLGKPSINKVKSIASSVIRRKSLSDGEESNEGSEDEEEEEVEDELSSMGVKIRRAELKRIGADEYDASSHSMDEGWDKMAGRQVLVSEDLTPPKKKHKKRSWSSGRVKSSSVVMPAPISTEEDERTVSADVHEIQDSPVDETESPFEAMRRKAFMKKTQQIQELKLVVNSEEKKEVTTSNDKEDVIVGEKRKKHKHKHKHKHHKKSKTERQIYMPPAKKLSGIQQDRSDLERKSSPSHIYLSSISSKSEDIPDYDDSIPTAPPSIPQPLLSVQQRPKPKAAALWAAGLSVSAKGVVTTRRPQQSQILSVTEKPESVPISSRISKSILSSSSLSSSISKDDEGIPVVKTFSQIMAEKRQKRMEAQGKSGKAEEMRVSVNSGVSSNSSSPIRNSTFKNEEPRPRVPITPILFSDASSKDTSFGRLKPPPVESMKGKTSSLTFNILSSKQTHISKSSSSSFNLSPLKQPAADSMSDLLPSYKKARAKKLFKKTKYEDEVEEQRSADTSVHISPPSSQQSNSMSSDASFPVPDKDNDVLKTSPIGAGKKERRASSASDTKAKVSLLDDEEFAFLDDDDMEDLGDAMDKDMEPIDDLLQDIDDLLA